MWQQCVYNCTRVCMCLGAFHILFAVYKSVVVRLWAAVDVCTKKHPCPSSLCHCCTIHYICASFLEHLSLIHRSESVAKIIFFLIVSCIRAENSCLLTNVSMSTGHWHVFASVCSSVLFSTLNRTLWLVVSSIFLMPALEKKKKKKSWTFIYGIYCLLFLLSSSENRLNIYFCARTGLQINNYIWRSTLFC